MLPRALRRHLSHALTNPHAGYSCSSIVPEPSSADVKPEVSEVPYSDVPRDGPRWVRKPYPTPVKDLIRRAKKERLARRDNPCRVLDRAPDNGLLVADLVAVARRVHTAGDRFVRALPELLGRHSDALPVHRCRYCTEIHIGKHGHEIRTCNGPGGASRNAMHVWRRGGIRDIESFPTCYHLFDRALKPRVIHKERCEVPKLPAIVELCIQAGVDVEEYPTRRRTKPVYSIDGRIVDFEGEEEEDVSIGCDVRSAVVIEDVETEEVEVVMSMEELGRETLRCWLEMRSGARQLMERYSVVTCGYCREVQVGPKGHKVRMCKATGHQQRDGLHAWQEATLDDLLWPNYVWHVVGQEPLANKLKRYYGKAPAVVELCVQAGAPVPDEFWSMMRIDVIAPDREEYDLVA